MLAEPKGRNKVRSRPNDGRLPGDRLRHRRAAVLGFALRLDMDADDGAAQVSPQRSLDAIAGFVRLLDHRPKRHDGATLSGVLAKVGEYLVGRVVNHCSAGRLREL